MGIGHSPAGAAGADCSTGKRWLPTHLYRGDFVTTIDKGIGAGTDFYTGKTCKFAISGKVQCKECDGQGGWGKKEVCCIGCNGEGVRVSKRGCNSISKSACIQCRGKRVKAVFDKVCRACNTLGVVPQRVVAEAKFEAGSRPGDRMVLKGMSDCLQGRPPGDVIVTATEKAHRIYKRSSKSKPHDLKCSIDISLRQSPMVGYSQAASGWSALPSRSRRTACGSRPPLG